VSTPAPKVLGIAGPSDSGKTTLIEKLLPLLRQRGIVVSTVKHVHHPVEIDTPGKDSFRHRQAGAREVMIALPDGWVLHHPAPNGQRPPLADILARMSACDLVLVEGYRDVVAVVGVAKPAATTVPAFARDDAAAIAAFIQQWMRR
jgi:molybdopterin-guanine dinucleotide biosynthesis protein B